MLGILVVSGGYTVECSRDTKVVREGDVCPGDGVCECDYRASTAQLVVVLVFGGRTEEDIVESFAKVFSGVVVEFLIYSCLVNQPSAESN